MEGTVGPRGQVPAAVGVPLQDAPPRDAAQPDVELVGVSKAFGASPAVADVSFSIPQGGFFSLLGPSGCGKSTTLRMIAGLEHPDSGSLTIAGHDMRGVPPYRRPTNMVFQRWALFPHMTVTQNVGFALETERVGKAETRARVGAMLDLVGLSALAARKPSQLSGGQMQRVALARALVKRPKVLLLDEPLGALDLQLRQQMQAELKRLHREVGTTFVYVTHDQNEAMTMSDSIAVMNGGRVEQIGTPRAIYDAPASCFVAGFIGHANILPVTIGPTHDGLAAVSMGGISFPVRTPVPVPPGPGHIALRYERIRIGHDASLGASCRGRARIGDVVFSGPAVRYALDAPALVAELPYDGSATPLAVGAEVEFGWDAAAPSLFVDG